MAKQIDLVSHAQRLIGRAAQIGLRAVQLVARLTDDLTLSFEHFHAGAGFPVFTGQMFHGLPMFLEFPFRLDDQRGRLLGLTHDRRHVVDLRAKGFEGGETVVEIRNARSDHRKLVRGVNRFVVDVLNRFRELGEFATPPVKLFEQGIESITLVASGKDDLVQVVGALPRLGSEEELFEHMCLLSAAADATTQLNWMRESGTASARQMPGSAGHDRHAHLRWIVRIASTATYSFCLRSPKPWAVTQLKKRAARCPSREEGCRLFWD